MPDDRVKISEFSTPVSLNNDDVIVIVQDNSGVKTTYKAPLTLLATQLLKIMQFASDLDTTNKAIIGAINEIAGNSVSFLNDLSDVTITNPSNGQIITYDAQTGKWINGEGSEVSFTSTISGAIASCDDGAENIPVNSWNVKIEPIQAGTGTPSTSNYRQITGWSSINIQRKSANIWDEEWESGTIDMSTGENEPSADAIRSKNFCECEPNTTYCLVKKPSVYMAVIYYTSSKVRLISQSYNNDDPYVVIQTNPSVSYFKIIYGNSTTPVTVYDNTISLNYPSTDTQYHSNIKKEILLPTSQLSYMDAFYGADLNITNGLGRINKSSVYLDDLISLTKGTEGNVIYYTYTVMPEYRGIPTTATLQTVISERFKCELGYVADDRCFINSSGNLVIVFADQTIATAKTARNWFGDNPTRFAIDIPDSRESALLNFTITPESINTEKGHNEFSADCGSSEVEYFNSLADEVGNIVKLLAPHTASDIDYDNTNSGLTADDVQSAIDEVAGNLGTVLTGTLTAGNTSLTLTDSAITTTAMYDFYTDVFGVNPTAVTVSTGSITLTFEARQADLNVKVVIR